MDYVRSIKWHTVQVVMALTQKSAFLFRNCRHRSIPKADRSFPDEKRIPSQNFVKIRLQFFLRNRAKQQNDGRIIDNFALYKSALYPLNMYVTDERVLIMRGSEPGEFLMREILGFHEGDWDHGLADKLLAYRSFS